jgi:predicted Holliday junction resolvase-like endonuclease
MELAQMIIVVFVLALVVFVVASAINYAQYRSVTVADAGIPEKWISEARVRGVSEEDIQKYIVLYQANFMELVAKTRGMLFANLASGIGCLLSIALIVAANVFAGRM